MRAARAVCLISSLASPALAGDFSLGLPLDCNLESDCFIQQYVDRDPGSGATDHTCGPLSYDGHKGTDFALATLRDLERLVPVVAAAAGKVIAVRDEMPDRLAGENAVSVVGRECGNGVLLDHGGGWVTQYCHMARNSIAVEPGDEVARGAALGTVGLSGETEFPHLHFELRKDGTPVDPFRPDGIETCGTDGPAALWDRPVAYRAGGLIDLGFAARLPDFDSVRAGTAGVETLNEGSAAVIVFAYLFGGRSGDVLHIRLDGPEGEVLGQSLELERTQAQLFRAIGKPRPAGGWPPGVYSAQATLIRDGAVMDALGGRIDLR